MYITNKHISRRTMLRGMGTAVALPLLEAMVPARRAFGKPTADPARLVCIEMVHGSAGSTKYGIEKKDVWLQLNLYQHFFLVIPFALYKNYRFL